MLKILVKSQNCLLQHHHGAQLDLCIFWCFASNSAFFKWHIFINDAKWTFAPDVFVSSITSLLLLTFVKFRKFSPIFPILVHRCFRWPEFALLEAYEQNLWTKLWCCNDFSPFPAIWSSWWVGIEFPIRILVDSSPSTIHASFVWILLDPPLPQFSQFYKA